ncbi:phage tail protein [Pedobacter gandavensis]|uniref:Phage tail protein n=1 Tax=Pedobacter gandavensis TaxID=2679963 RepID=A0ABR6EXB6_9SPHI|nr:tail fiber protein [Pedobacter gandavensis]MBB2149930.1 phage tail protein [Pedobacter gandavensis]
MENFVGEIRLFGFTFPPRGWAVCNGQIIAIQANTALFSLLGTQYGGNGTTTFGLPDLRGRAAIGFGQGPGLSDYVQGEVSGTENISISINNMPAHTHIAKVSTQEGSVADPVTGNSLAAMVDTSVNKILSYSTAAPTVALNTNTNSITGANIPISIMQPTLALNYCIATTGVFPSRN